MTTHHLPFTDYEISIAIDETAARVASDQPLAVLSSAVVGGDLRATRHIVNMHVRKGYASENPENDLRAFAARLEIAEPFVGMMTAAYTQNARVAIESRDGITVAAIVTAGLSNLIAAGISEPTEILVGTINTILLIDAALTEAAMANAIITATEAKTLTLIERDARTREGDFASGTSTDSIAVACTHRGEPLRYAGAATILGWLIARTTRNALTQSLIAREQSLR
ncbi:MAG: adenosylcobinamide amidohydrolase [Chloroflexi bacterium]|nr:adenosylcobinamide amidohydrolase [Chloroflexota bacterium]